MLQPSDSRKSTSFTFYVSSLLAAFTFLIICILCVPGFFCKERSPLPTSYEPWHDKTNRMSVRSAKTQISLGIRRVWSRVFAARMMKAWVLSYALSAQRRLWSDWANAQADLSFRLAHTHFVGFVMSRLIYGLSMTGSFINHGPRAKNYLEGWRRSFSSIIDVHHPDIYKFLTKSLVSKPPLKCPGDVK